MGFEDGQMVLDSPNGTYYIGQTIRGNLIFQQDKVKTFRGIFVKFRGYCKVHWTTTETRRVNDRDETYTREHDSYEEYINMRVYLVGGESGDHHIQPGKYDYPFTFQLPANCPSSFEGEYGHVRYEIKAVVDRAFKFDQEKMVAIRVLAPLDLNRDPYCREPIEIDISDTYCCCCFSSGSTETVINAPMSGYCSGQKIPIEIACSNKGTVDIGHIKLRLVKKIEFIATHEPDTRKNKEIIAEIKKSSIPGDTTRNWTIDMEIPALDVCNLSGCSYIHIDYKFEVIVSPEGCHNDTEDSRKIIIGTIPLAGFQDNVVNPLHDQMPQQIAAITQQPVSSYPATNPYPYPGDNAPYPTNTPYPNNPNQSYSVTTPLLNSNAPYPTNDSFKSPYGADNLPYSTSNPPYPSNNASASPYPANNPPYPVDTPIIGANPPYPAKDATKSPYPPSNSPYPAETPNIVTNPPYPIPDASKSPYPSTNSPYPAGNPNTGTNPPYPTNDATKSPYPPTNSPYAAGIPNTSSNPPYPIPDASKSPYPATNPPYLAGTPNTATNPPYPSNDATKSPYPPYPTGTPINPPYPSQNSPYPDNPPPYPGNNAPYPTGQQNTPNQIGSFGGRLLKTGTIGFTVQSNVRSMPFPAAPISPAPVNPYMAASAPALDSPDTEKKKENE